MAVRPTAARARATRLSGPGVATPTGQARPRRTPPRWTPPRPSPTTRVSARSSDDHLRLQQVEAVGTPAGDPQGQGQLGRRRQLDRVRAPGRVIARRGPDGRSAGRPGRPGGPGTAVGRAGRVELRGGPRTPSGQALPVGQGELLGPGRGPDAGGLEGLRSDQVPRATAAASCGGGRSPPAPPRTGGRRRDRPGPGRRPRPVRAVGPGGPAPTRRVGLGMNTEADTRPTTEAVAQ